ncbi:amidohydrolase family protein [Sediminibacterium goheungense]|uniref:Imidazolonepropionase-like amidohydrolase n=1 Tax=Sediminibacterium goheungense TaxID=1086393 RepID=A0A4R6J3T0_9BACT|nr:amidohydrolase family protein [Sediminibacterium goheungense]TDO29431.1 imidazolonepropionase-like amidohydrolase [Sediminibacterium goheungense]
MRRLKLLFSGLLFASLLQAQETFQVNGVGDKRDGCYAFTNATIVKDAQTTLTNATLVIRDGKIVSVGNGVAIPKDAVVVDCKDKYIYPSFVDIFSDYGMPQAQRQQGGGGFNFNAPAQLTSSQKGAYGWNQALKSDVQAYKIFSADESRAKPLRDMGFGTVLSHQKDGITRGTGTVVTLANDADNYLIVKDKASAHLSFNKGTSTQSYPGSLMGTIALLRQTYLDAQWYKNNPAAAGLQGDGVNITLKYFNDQQTLPQIFDPADRAGTDFWNIIRADRVGDEFGVQYILKATGKEYQRIKEVAATKAPLIVGLNFPAAMDVEDPNDARLVSLADMKNWELAPTNPAAIEKAGISFALTSADLRDARTFMTNLRKAMENGLTEKGALEALTKTPATWLGVYDKVGSIDNGKLANFVITTGPVFAERTTILQNWVQGKKHAVNESAWNSVTGLYTLTTNGSKGTNTYTVDVKSSSSATVIAKDTVTATFSFDGKAVKFSFAPERRSRNIIRFSGFNNGGDWNGMAEDAEGNRMTWTATLNSAKPDTANARTRPTPPNRIGKTMYPFTAFGSDSTLPQQGNYLIKNATVWTSEKEGKLEGTDVLVKAGKIVRVGKNLSDAAATVIDGTGKHLTAGIIDEHSHIASASTNEGAQSVTSEVRMQDNLDPDDINIYRQLSGGVTTSHILHGSANTIGGQTQLIKLRWGVNDEELKFKNWDPFIKFALGENVKRTSSTNNNRFPDTRMGVEQVLTDAFTRAVAYEKAMKADPKGTRRDLELDALVEIMNKKRFITCHSYVQSEITATMRVAEKFGFRVNTFTHILEGYKVADKMKAHGAAASTFSDWWAYKVEVTDAIPYNAYIMNKVGLNVAINSDDAEMARRLNQEAAKSVKYGGLSEEEALRMVTINPAKMLHVDDRVGSIKAGKDADLVLWSDNPLSIYAKAEKTMVDGIIYFDREKDAAMRKQVLAERTRLIGKMVGEKRGGRPTMPATPSYKYVHTCLDHSHKLGMLEIEAEEETHGDNQ